MSRQTLARLLLEGLAERDRLDLLLLASGDTPTPDPDPLELLRVLEELLPPGVATVATEH